MSSFEDHFSEQARQYARYRPQYPGELFDYLASISPGTRLAWDVGTGSGQAARSLAEHFDCVLATDASAEQIAQAVAHTRIDYRVERAEDVSLEPASVDLVTVATAVHWFDLDAFYSVVRRVAVPGGILAVWTYHAPKIDPAIDSIIYRLSDVILEGYWPQRFNYLSEHYRTLPFPFEEISPPYFEMKASWKLDQFVGFLDSWSATRRYRNQNGQHPLELVWQELSQAWVDPSSVRRIRWPLYMRVGRVI